MANSKPTSRSSASGESFRERFVRKYVRAQLRGGESVIPWPTEGVGVSHSGNSYLASSPVGRWFTRWLYTFVLVSCIFALAFLAAFLITQNRDLTASGYVMFSALGVLIVLFATRLQYGVRWMFRHRRDARRQSSRR